MNCTSMVTRDIPIDPNLKLVTVSIEDSDLGEEIKGEYIAKNLYDQGYKNVYLATGYHPSDFDHLKWLKGVIGKTPPWQK